MQQQPSPIDPMPENWQTALAIAAHPDDLENGASSAVAKWTAQGKHIVYLMVSRGEAGIDALPPWNAGPLRAEKDIGAARVVGVEESSSTRNLAGKWHEAARVYTWSHQG